MATNANGFWDFKSYSERTWFKYLVIILLVITASYILFHYFYRNKNYDYEYTRLNQDQMQVLNRIYMDAVKPDSTESKKDSAAPTIKTPSATNNLDKQRLVIKVMDYLDNTFDQSLEKIQSEHIECFLEEATPEESTAYLNQTRFKVKSYFWLIGPSVYWEVVFWTLFGVLCNLLFILGAVGSNATTDLANPQSQFDNSEILGQVARLLYAPLCTLAVILGYNFFKDQNVVDIDSSKGLIVFAFIGGYYSSRVIALMDRLKDVLLPNSGASSLATQGSSTIPLAVIPQLKVQLAFDSAVPRTIIATPATLNNSIVTLTGVGQGKHYTAVHTSGDPDGLLTFSSVNPGDYIINASLTLPASAQQQSQNLSGVIKGQILSGTAPIPLTLKLSNVDNSTHSIVTPNTTHNMSTIKIAATADQVQLNFSFQTQQVFSYKIQVMDDAGNVSFSDNGSWNGKRSFTLGQGSDLVGKYLSIDWSIIDPQGAGNIYTAAADASQNNNNCPASQTISGTSTATAVNQSSSAQFLS